MIEVKDLRKYFSSGILKKHWDLLERVDAERRQLSGGQNQDLKRELHLTLLFISHDLEVVRHMSDRIAVMYLGKIVEIGNAKDIFGYGRHPYTNTLISSVSVGDVILDGDMKMIELEKGHWVASLFG